MLNKHKLFLLCAKWIPVVTAIGILVTNTIAYYGCNDIVVDIFNFNIGTSVAGVILMYVCSYAFNFCIWHKLVITYNALIIAIVFIIRYCITECSYSYLLLSKSTRDSFDITNARVGELEKQVAVLIATRPYQDALIQSDIRRVAEHADFNLFRRTCRMITGELVLPNTPTVTGYPSYNPCRVDNSTSTPAA